MVDDTDLDKIWEPRSVAETRALYADWAGSYDDDITAMSYATPDRIAQALFAQDPDLTAPILDFGCGTGLSGLALKNVGFQTIDGTDISPQMLTLAKPKTFKSTPVYRKLWLGNAGEMTVQPGDYSIIVATGVVSLGAAPPEVLDSLMGALATGGLLAFSYNDPTLRDPDYMGVLNRLLANGTATQLFRENGPHLNAKVTGSDVIVLRRL